MYINQVRKLDSPQLPTSECYTNVNMLDLSRKWVGWRLTKLLLVTIPALCLFFFLYVWRLGNLVPGLSRHESAERVGSSSLTAIKNNPINAPHKILQFILQHFGHHGAFWMRVVSVFFAFLFLSALFLLLRKWFGNLVGFIGALFLAMTPWVVILARSATSDIMLLSPILVIFSYISLTKLKKWHSLMWFVFIVCVALALYAPGIIWFVLLGVTMNYKNHLKVLSTLSTSVLGLGFVLFLVLIYPLVYGIYLHPSLVKNLLLVPQNFPSGLEIVKSFVWSTATLMIKARHHMEYIVGTLAMLSIAQSLLAIIGIYVMAKSAKREVYVLVSLLVISVVAAALNENIVLLTLCLPTLAIFDAAAMRFLYVKWFKVFPLNPLPRLLAFALIILLIASQISYGLRYTLNAWPHNQDTRKIYVLK